MKQMLLDGSKQLNIDMDNSQIDQLQTYADLLVEWNEKINLTAITDPEGIATKHFLDSLTPILTGKIHGSVIDVGTGAGFPGLVLKIAKPDIQLTLLDSLNKRLNFLKEVTDTLKIYDGVEFVHARAEDGGQNHLYRGKFDVAVSRAVANMTVLCELCLPFVKVGGVFLAMKGPLADDELTAAKRAISILGGEVCEVIETSIPFTDLKHNIIMIKKVRQTPMQYPRKAGIPTKTPIDTCYNLKKSAKK